MHQLSTVVNYSMALNNYNRSIDNPVCRLW